MHEPHHDGSELYVLEHAAAPGEELVVRLRVPHRVGADAVAVRYLHDQEPRFVPGAVDQRTATDTWWRARFPVWNPQVRYRWLVAGGGGYAWVTAAGLVTHDVPEAEDFVVSLSPGGPAWHRESVVYQIFPDRFARGGAPAAPPAWAVPRAWDEAPVGRGPDTPFEWFGGDLAGVAAHLDHVERLGASVVYLTPFFPAFSTHRYDATTFDRVDPLLGGDEALARLVSMAHARGIRVVGDLTLNHCGVGHEWFVIAAENPGAVERGFFWFDDALEHGYEAWLDVPTLPRLDHRSGELRRRLYEGEDAVARRWLRGSDGIDGWRIDVANMTGRHRDVDVAHEVARGLRAAVQSERPDAVLVAEHGHDARDDLRGDGWHGVMAYAAFTRPVWCWLRRPDLPAPLDGEFLGVPVGVPRLRGGDVTATMRRMRAGMPWSAVAHSWNLLDSHDTARFRTVAGSREHQVVGVGLQAGMPGVPMVFAGDELGLEGRWGEDARRTMPWGSPETWDGLLLDEYRALLALRRSERALSHGGMRYVHVGDDAVVFERETRDDRLLCLASRAPGAAPVRLAAAALGCSELETLYGSDASVGGDDLVLPAEGPTFAIWRLS